MQNLFQQTAVQRCPCLCHDDEPVSYFLLQYLTNSKSIFSMKTIKSRLFNKYFKIRKFVTWFAGFQWEKIIENYNSDDAGIHKAEKIASGPTLVLLWPRPSNIRTVRTGIWKYKFHKSTKMCVYYCICSFTMAQTLHNTETYERNKNIILRSEKANLGRRRKYKSGASAGRYKLEVWTG